MPFGFPPERAFGFAGILNQPQIRLMCHIIVGYLGSAPRRILPRWRSRSMRQSTNRDVNSLQIGAGV
jgi:hypothetical protein